MNTIATTLTQQVARFETVRLPDGWSVVDLLSETVIATSRAWDKLTAATVNDALNAEPAYTVQFRWSAVEMAESHPPVVTASRGDY